VQVGLIELLQCGHLSERNSILNINQSLVEKRLSAVMVGEVEKKLPANGLACQEAEAGCLFLAGNFGTGG